MFPQISTSKMPGVTNNIFYSSILFILVDDNR